MEYSYNELLITPRNQRRDRKINITGLSIITLWFYCVRTKVTYFDTKDENTIILNALYNNVNAQLFDLHI